MILTLPTIFMIFCIVVMILQLLYITLQKPSYYQCMLTICLSAMIIWFVGYMVEIEYCDAGDWEKAFIGTRISYIGKPFALLSMFYFLAYYTNVRLPNVLNILLTVLHFLLSSVAFSSNYHKLFYTSVGFDEATHSLVLGHGPFYYLYMVSAISFFIANLWLYIRARRAAKTHEDHIRAVFLAMPLFFGVGGYLIFLTGISGGFDTTVFGCLLASLCLFILFTKYHLFDNITFAKEQMLDSLSDGFILKNSDGDLEYANDVARMLFPALCSSETEKAALKEITALAKTNTLHYYKDKVYELTYREIGEYGFVSGIMFEFQDITDTYQYASRLEREVDLKTHRLADMQYRIVESFAELIEARDETTGDHVNRCSGYVSSLCRELHKRRLMPPELPDNFVSVLVHVAPLHDIGKIALPDAILQKPDRLTKEEFDIIKTHTTKGAHIIDNTFHGIESDEYIAMAKEVAMYHHERWDGSGYPEGRKEMDIPFAAQIMSLCDVYDALRSKRPYKEPYSKEMSMEIIAKERGKQFNPEMTDVFLEMVKKMP